MHIKYGDNFEGTLPEKSVTALISRGLNHYMSSEVAAKVKAAQDKAEEAGEAFNRDAYKAEVQQAFWQALVDGKVGEGNRGPRGTPLETLMRQIAEREIRDILAKEKLTMPTGDKTVKFKNGQEFTRAQLIDRRLANEKFGSAIRAEAEKELKARERKASKALDEASDLMDAIG